MKIVITGANSFIGRTLSKRALEKGWDVILSVRPGREKDLPQNTHFLPICMEEYERLGDLVGECDCFIHLAWKGTRGLYRMDSRLQAENVRDGRKAIKSMIRAGCKKVITAGSQAEYGPHYGQITEESVCIPNTAYGKAKLEFYEQTVQECRKEGVAYKALRIFSLYGPGDDSSTMISRILRNMQENRPCELTQGIQMWDYLHIEDAVDSILRLCNMPCEDGVYNLGSGHARQLRDYVLEMAQIVHSDSPLLFGMIPYPETGMISLWPDVTKLKHALNWEPQISFEEGIRSILANGYTLSST